MRIYRVEWLNSYCFPCVCDVVALSEIDAKNRIEMRGVVEKFISIQREGKS